MTEPAPDSGSDEAKVDTAMSGPERTFEAQDDGAEDLASRGDQAIEQAADSAKLPEEAISQPMLDERDLQTTGQAELRATYGYLRAYFKSRPKRFRAHQRRLKQARIRQTYDVYLAESVRWAGIAAVLGAIGGLLVVAAVVVTGLPLEVFGSVVAVSGTVPGFVSTYPALATGLVLAGLGFVVAGTGTLLFRLYSPRRAIASRRRSIDHNLPYAIMFMFALSRGGMNFLDICKRLAGTHDMYGEVANEFDMVVREIDLFGNGLLRALDNVRTLTPSDNLQRFLDDLLSVLESGGDLEPFFQTEAEKYIDTAQEEQEAFVETLGTLSELFVVAFVAAPLLLIVVLMVVSFLGAETLGIIALLVYVVFPLGMIGFLLVIHHLSHSTEVPANTVDIDGDRLDPPEGVANDPRYTTYDQTKSGDGLRTFLSKQFRAIRRRPLLSLWLTVPAGIVVGGLVILLNLAQPTTPAFVSTPVLTTTGIVVAPLLTAAVPLMALHEFEHRRTREIAHRLPDILDILANANEMGIGLIEGCELVTEWESGTLAEEFQKVRNDLAWNHDIKRALGSLANRLAVPQLTRTMTLIAEGSRSSADLHSLLEIAADDTRARAKLERARRRTVNAYVVIVVIGFLVYLLVIIMVSASYLEPISELTAGTGGAAQPASLASVGATPVGTYRLLFLHSALIQGFGSGLIAGKLADNDILSGLTYGVALVVVTVAAFVLFI